QQDEKDPQTRQCDVCGDEASVSEFPSLAGCRHLPQTCSDCYKKWIAAQLPNNSWREVTCPEKNCDIRLTYSDIQQTATRETFEQYDTFIARAALNADPNFRWCRSCDSGQIHTSGEEGNICTCAWCGRKTCVVHGTTWHDGETCEEYDHRSSKRAQDAASVATISMLSKKCPGPGCLYNIEKNEGCNHMTCSQCKYEFCWIC
ncbi:hypothetical protein EK21DRAFT_11365, partial [Setomelanomma holmii]